MLRDAEAGASEPGVDADDRYFYLVPVAAADIGAVSAALYAVDSREPFGYKLEALGRDSRLVRFDVLKREFTINSDHELSLNFADEVRARDLLYDVATAEALLEVYLREAGLPASAVGEVLERRDVLLRTLAREQMTSPAAIAASIRDASANERDLEVALIISARALGFVAKHLSGATNPDGIAKFRDYPAGERRITLEAKSSAQVPSLGAIDFAGLAQHVTDQRADGCLLVAPAYPGGSRGDASAAALRAKQLRISCWTTEQLARAVEALETRDITARQVLDIVLHHFTPDDVAAAVDDMLSAPTHPSRTLASAMVDALQQLEGYGLPDQVRSLDMLSVEVARAGMAAPVQELRAALTALASASQGALAVHNDRVLLNTSVQELRRRVAATLGGQADSRRASTFRGRPEPER